MEQKTAGRMRRRRRRALPPSRIRIRSPAAAAAAARRIVRRQRSRFQRGPLARPARVRARAACAGGEDGGGGTAQHAPVHVECWRLGGGSGGCELVAAVDAVQMAGLAASASRKEMLALSCGIEEAKVGGMSLVDRAKSGFGAGGNAVIGVLQGALRRMGGSKADGENVPVLYLVAVIAFASESKFKNLEGGEEKAEMFVNGCRLVEHGGVLCIRLEIVAFADAWLWFSSYLLAPPISCWQN